MSEYQYYEFLAIDKPLSMAELRWARSLSTRAEITPTSFINTYQWGDFKGDPRTMMERCFDAFVYVSNFGYQRFMLKLPVDSLAVKRAKPYCRGYGARLSTLKKCILLEFAMEGDPGDWEFDDDGSRWMRSLVPLRDDLLYGDWRALYLAWLLNIRCEEFDEGDLEPPVPPGLVSLSASLTALADFLRIDKSLIDVAALRTSPLAKRAKPEQGLLKWMRSLPVNQKDAVIARLLCGEGSQAKLDLVNRFNNVRKYRLQPHGNPGTRSVSQLHKEWMKRTGR